MSGGDGQPGHYRCIGHSRDVIGEMHHFDIVLHAESRVLARRAVRAMRKDMGHGKVFFLSSRLYDG